MSALNLWADTTRVGTVDVADGLWGLRFAGRWKSFVLSAKLPLASRQFKNSPRERQVEWFFENLLPEGTLRELIAQRDGFDPRDTWALLARHGQDTAGALSVLPEGGGPRRRRGPRAPAGRGAAG